MTESQGMEDSARDLLDQIWDENAAPFEGPGDDDGQAGVREPRRPKPRPASGGAASPI